MTEEVLPPAIESIIIGYAVNENFGGILMQLKNDVETIEWYYNRRFRLNDQHIDPGWEFTNSCLGGYLETTKWLYNMVLKDLLLAGKKISWIGNIDIIFENICNKDDLGTAKWLYDEFKKVRELFGVTHNACIYRVVEKIGMEGLLLG